MPGTHRTLRGMLANICCIGCRPRRAGAAHHVESRPTRGAEGPVARERDRGREGQPDVDRYIVLGTASATDTASVPRPIPQRHLHERGRATRRSKRRDLRSRRLATASAESDREHRELHQLRRGRWAWLAPPIRRETQGLCWRQWHKGARDRIGNSSHAPALVG